MDLDSVIKKGIDVHTHCSPSVFPRKLTVWEMVKQAEKNGLSGIVLKSHESSTAEQASVVNMVQDNIVVHGGIVLNEFVGGLNPAAVDVSLKMGGKFVWMPTISSVQHIQHFRGSEGKLFQGIDKLTHSKEGITILNEKGQLKDEVFEILDLVKKYDAVICSGHISLKELKILAETVFEKNIQKFLVTHPDMDIAPVPLGYQKELASKGALLEKCYLATGDEFNDLTVQNMKQTIDEIGYKNCVLVTDYGQNFNINPIQAMKNFIEKLVGLGVSWEQINRMYVQNPHILTE